MNSLPEHPPYPLSMAKADAIVRLDRISGGEKVKSHLQSLGFVPGVELHVVSTQARGPLIVSLKDGRLALDQGMAQHIWVRSDDPATRRRHSERRHDEQ